MKVFISADIEGIAFANDRQDIMAGGTDYTIMREEMTKEVLAAIEGALAAGATDITVKDAHGSGNNIYPERMPECVTLIRGWSGDPRLMLEGLDNTFDAAMYVGYHSAGGSGGNALAHTIYGSKVHRILINSKVSSEFDIFAATASYYEVPSVFLSGDKNLCDHSLTEYPHLIVVALRDDKGAASYCMSSDKACRLIKEKVQTALTQGFKNIPMPMASDYSVQLIFKDHKIAYERHFYPGATLSEPYCVSFKTDNWFEVLRFLHFMLV